MQEKDNTLNFYIKQLRYKNKLWDDEVLNQPFAEFDFSYDCDSYNYIKCKDLYEKYKAYKLPFRKIAFTDHRLEEMRKAYRENYKGVIDPDSNSKLLQIVYKKLWDENVISICSKNGHVYGDVMNSIQTSLNAYIWEEYPHKASKSSLGNCLLCFEEGVSNECKMMIDFLSFSHMLGNFIPVPIGCNGPRGKGELKDYWDLTLYYIYKYYSEGKKERILEKIIGKQNINKYKEWLDIFEDDWNGFVKKNYLQPFVPLSTDGINFGEPLSLWDDHFSDESNILPNKHEALMYFENAKKRICERSCLMIEELKKRL